MRLSTRKQCKALDQKAQSEFGLRPEVLMESAGAAVAEEVNTLIKNKKCRVLVLAGSGNNGADGFVIARLLKRKGFANLACVIVREKASPSGIWTLQLSKAQNSGVEILRVSGDRMKMEVGNSEVIVEAILGTGFSSSLDAELSDLVQFINSKNKVTIAVDAPIGLDIDTGLEKPKALRATMTVTFGLSKPGFYVARGPRCVGQVKVHGIGFPQKLLRDECQSHFAWGAHASREALPGRDELSNKSDHGTVHVIAGSSEYPGAGLLSANAAGRAGAGYVYLHGATNVYQHVQMIPEVILRDAAKWDWKSIDKKSTVIVGPGLGVNAATETWIRELLKRKWERVILDADALTVLAEKKIWPLPSEWIVTPHAGELSRILGRTVKSLNADRFAAAIEAQKKLCCVVLFKGFRTVVADSSSRAIVILSGNSGLAKAGSGDVLGGFVAAFRAQGLSATRAACLGAYLHGRLANEWVHSGKDIISLLPSDLSVAVPQLIHRIRSL